MSDLKPTTSIDQVEDVKSGSIEPASKHQHAEGNALLLREDGQIRKLPVPSSDPNDPLNFPPWMKYSVIFCCCWFSIMSLSLASGLGAILSVFIEQYVSQGYNTNQITFLITLPTLCIGLGNYVILPLSLAYGCRPVFLGAIVILLGATIGSAAQNSYEGHLATRVVAGLATGATESLLPLMLTEVTFLHERGRIFGIYWMVQNALSSALNLASSYENAALGWRWYYWVYAIAVGVGAVAAVFGAFETRFARPAASLDGRVVVTDEFGVTRVIPDAEAQEYLARLEREGSGGGGGGKEGGGGAAAAAAPSRKTYQELLRPWSAPHPRPLSMMLQSWLRMLQSATSPAILYAVLISSITLGCGVAISLTYDAVLQSYGWPAASIGLVNIGGVLGAVLGAAYCTFVGEPLVLYMARRNRGVHLPEHRLPVLVIPAALGFASLLLYGFTAGGGSTWWGPYVGWTINQFSFTCVLIISTTFASEASPKHPGPALVVVVGTKNIISFGVTYGLTPMVEAHGYKWAFGVLGGIFLGIFLLGIPVYILNPYWRRYISRMEEKQGVATAD